MAELPERVTGLDVSLHAANAPDDKELWKDDTKNIFARIHAMSTGKLLENIGEYIQDKAPRGSLAPVLITDERPHPYGYLLAIQRGETKFESRHDKRGRDTFSVTSILAPTVVLPWGKMTESFYTGKVMPALRVQSGIIEGSGITKFTSDAEIGDRPVQAHLGWAAVTHALGERQLRIAATGSYIGHGTAQNIADSVASETLRAMHALGFDDPSKKMFGIVATLM